MSREPIGWSRSSSKVAPSYPWPVLLEIYYMTRREHGQAEADRRYALASKLKVQVVWRMDEQILLTAGRLKAEHRLSFADALIAAFALREGATLVHQRS